MAIGTGETFMDDLTKIFGLKSADAKAEKLKEFTDQSLERQILSRHEPVGYEGTIDSGGYKISYRIPRSNDVTLTGLKRL